MRTWNSEHVKYVQGERERVRSLEGDAGVTWPRALLRTLYRQPVALGPGSPFGARDDSFLLGLTPVIPGRERGPGTQNTHGQPQGARERVRPPGDMQAVRGRARKGRHPERSIQARFSAGLA
ncbi:hypothetical protein GCM10011322_17410 [Salinarimonas ramus]|uniref:Uncharacterized protein n=1 Tax=Salinarimonas ramus TaxID=690164 RepID=A0A917V3F7_9HYPH|nr:hypothetical protein GCM10011322_17410 [Salinarimonas ramus]